MDFLHRSLAVIVALLSVLTLHSGRTDSNGGHWDYSTGTYHYHHGYPAHQHPNGVCPYSPNYSSNGPQAKYNPHSSDSSSSSSYSSDSPAYRSSSSTATQKASPRKILGYVIVFLITPPYGWAVLILLCTGLKKLSIAVWRKCHAFMHKKLDKQPLKDYPKFHRRR